MKATVVMDFAKYPHLELERNIAIKFLDIVIKKRGLTRDLEESKRIVLNFNEYYNIARKFNGSLTVIKDPTDSIRGRVFIHKIKLIRRNSKELVELVIDRRVPREFVESALRETGFTEVEFVYVQ